MNTVLGAFILILNGQIESAFTTGAYPSEAACQQAVKQVIAQKLQASGPPPDGVHIAILCVDLTDDLNSSPHVKT